MDLKKTSYKKLSKLLSVFEKRGVLSQKLVHKQEHVASVSRTHALYTAFAGAAVEVGTQGFVGRCADVSIQGLSGVVLRRALRVSSGFVLGWAPRVLQGVAMRFAAISCVYHGELPPRLHGAAVVWTVKAVRG